MTFPSPKAGDILLYRREGWVNTLIEIKTSSIVSHCEMALGNGESLAARGGGVNRYPFTSEGLFLILTPTTPPDMPALLRWFTSVQGQGYDWVGLFLGFIARTWGNDNQKMFCSEFATRALRRGGVHPFRPSVDADSIHPGDFFKSPAFTVSWAREAQHAESDVTRE